MRALIPAVVASVILFSPVVRAGEQECATSPELNEWLREAGVWSAGRARHAAGKGLTQSAAALRGDVFVLPADDTNAPFRRPFDLEGRTLVFERTGTTGFAVRNLPLETEETAGTRLVLQGSSEPHARVELDFDFPFFNQSVRTIYVSGNNGIFLSEPQQALMGQYGDADLAGERQPVIAPLLTTRSSRLTPTPAVFAHQNGTSAVITWSAEGAYHVRATLSASGEIRFSYEHVGRAVAGAALLITSGDEAWRSRTSTLGQVVDAEGDFSPPSGVTPSSAVAGMLDITRLALRRINDLDLYEARIRTRQAVDAASLRDGDVLQYVVTVGGQAVRLHVYADGRQRYLLPVWGWKWGSKAARIEGDEIVLSFVREHIAAWSAVPVRATSRIGSAGDSSPSMTVSLPVSPDLVRTDFSATTEAVLDDRPIAEAFSAPVLSVYRVWEQIKQTHPALKDDEIDGVAIYQNFYTDLVTYAGAYSTGGNPGASGLSDGDGNALTEPRSPALMHMNAVGYGHNRTSPGASRVVLHELGHRWLLFTSLMENGERARTLNPVSAHPAQYVDTRAAFKVYTDADTSVMGGGFFTDHLDGNFSTGGYGPYGYSWLDLYLIGLAGPEEVPPMFYVDDAAPKLGDEYYAPANQTYTGTRRDFTIQNVIDGTGPRKPAYPETQRHFRVVFVLLTDPQRAPTDEELASVDHYRQLLEADFRTATSGRGTVSTTTAAQPSGPRRRAAGK